MANPCLPPPQGTYPSARTGRLRGTFIREEEEEEELWGPSHSRWSCGMDLGLGA